LTAPDGVVFDNFGNSVSASPGVILVGALFDDVSFQDQGSAYVFWRERLELASPAWANGMFHATIIGTPGLDFSLRTSTDFMDWTTVTNASLSSDSMAISVPAPAPWGVYRATSPPVP
jgi:hypothetical protein